MWKYCGKHEPLCGDVVIVTITCSRNTITQPISNPSNGGALYRVWHTVASSRSPSRPTSKSTSCAFTWLPILVWVKRLRVQACVVTLSLTLLVKISENLFGLCDCDRHGDRDYERKRESWVRCRCQAGNLDKFVSFHCCCLGYDSAAPYVTSDC